MKYQGSLIKRDPRAAWQEVDDKVVVVTPQNKTIHILDGSGRSIWSCLEGPKKFEDMVAVLCEEYEVKKEQAEEDLSDYLRDLAEKELITLDEA